MMLSSATWPYMWHLCGIAPVTILCQALLETINWKNWGTCLLRIAKLPGHFVAMVDWQDSGHVCGSVFAQKQVQNVCYAN